MDTIEFKTIIDKYAEKPYNGASITDDNLYIKNLTLDKKGFLSIYGNNISFENCIFNETHIINSHFIGNSWFENCVFINSKLSKSIMDIKYIQKCIFLEVDFFELDIEEIDIKDSFFYKCDFSASSFDRSVIKDSKFLDSCSLLKQEVFKDAVEENVKWIP